MTFHWATNHGAVLQTYATLNYLKNEYHKFNVEIINYSPKRHRVTISSAIKKTIKERELRGILEYIKEISLKRFRKKHLVLSQKYDSYELLRARHDHYDIIFFGSDQIWNPAFLLNGESKTNDAYFGGFCSNRTKKTALSVSFGCTEYPQRAKEIAEPLIKSFGGISVREKSGLTILSEMGNKTAIQLSDPTVLLNKDIILALCDMISTTNNATIVVNCIRKHENMKPIIDAYKKEIPNSNIIDIQMLSIERWLAAIRDSTIVITDSFHCVMMCLIMHRDFIILPAEGKLAGMNDRFTTILESLNLLDRIYVHDVQLAKTLISIDNWDVVDCFLQTEREKLAAFINAQLFDSLNE